MKKTYHILLYFLLSLSTVKAQVNIFKETEEDRFKGIIFRNELAMDLRLHTNGFSLGYNIGNIRTFYRSSFYHYELGMMYDNQEHNQTKSIGIAGTELAKKFKYGKQNSVLIARAGRGLKRYITDKAKRKGVSIGYSAEAGVALAFLKPYYINVIDQIVVGGEPRTVVNPIKYSEETASRFLDYDKIYGGTSFFKGLDEIKFVPGIQVKSGIFFSTGVFDKYVRNGEVGIMADFFIKKIPIMVETDKNRNSPLLLNLYLNLQIGKRSN